MKQKKRKARGTVTLLLDYDGEDIYIEISDIQQAVYFTCMNGHVKAVSFKQAKAFVDGVYSLYDKKHLPGQK